MEHLHKSSHSTFNRTKYQLENFFTNILRSQILKRLSLFIYLKSYYIEWLKRDFPLIFCEVVLSLVSYNVKHVTFKKSNELKH